MTKKSTTSKHHDDDIRRDASGRELLPHEVSPADQADNPLAEDGELPEAQPEGHKPQEN